MTHLPPGLRRGWLSLLGFFMLSSTLLAQTPAPDEPITYSDDEAALVLARQYFEGGAGSRTALMEALKRMGWDLRNTKGAIIAAAPAATRTGLAMRDHEVDELLWKPLEQPSLRLISYAQAIAVPFEDADAEELAQDLVDAIRACYHSDQPQKRFWARFIVALGQVGPSGYDLSAPSPPSVMQPGPSQEKRIAKLAQTDPLAVLDLMQPRPVWSKDDPVLAPSPKPELDEDDPRQEFTSVRRDEKRSEELSKELDRMVDQSLKTDDPEKQKAMQEKMEAISNEMTAMSYRRMAASLNQTAASMEKKKTVAGDDEEDDEDEDEEDEEEDEPRFTAEWREQPLSMLQVALITRVFVADLRLITAQKLGTRPRRSAALEFPALPLAALGFPRVAQTPIGDQVSGAAGDIWATVTGAYTGGVVTHYFGDDNKYSKGSAIANAIIAWFKTIVSVIQQNLTIEVENAPLVRTKTRVPGEQRTAKARIAIDFPKSDVLKAIRAAGNLTAIDLQMPDGGPISGAKVVWRLPEGSHNGRYQTGNGGFEYRPDLAIVQFGQGAGFVSSTDANGIATIVIEGVAQRKNLPPTVRPYPRRAAITIEVTMKVGNMTQDLNDAIGLATGEAPTGALSFLADMILRTSFFFQKNQPFEVIDWKEPAWQGEFEITVKGSGSKTEKGEKGGPDITYTWSLDRYMEGRMHTPDWAEELEADRDYQNEARHKLDIDGDRRYFRLKDSSSAKSRDMHNRYQANGPLQLQPPGHNQLAHYSRAEPSGSAELTFTGGKMILDLSPFFGAECLVTRSEQNKGRSSNRTGREYLSLLDGISPGNFTIIEENDGSQEFVEGSKTFDYYRGTLPYVEGFDVTVTVEYRLWKNTPPKNKKNEY